MKSQLLSNEFRGTYLLYKQRGETLTVLLERFRTEHDLVVDTKLTYAGRLDPMAEGLVLVLAGEDRFQKDVLLGLEKTYIVEVVLGIGSDTHDPLGIVTEPVMGDIAKEEITATIEQMHSITELPYPMYSSVPVDGKPLFVHARAGNNVEAPMKRVQIKQVTHMTTETSSVRELADAVVKDIQKVQGDFRQAEIIQRWKEVASRYGDQVLPAVTLSITASSGTYMRSLAVWMGERLGVPALALSIKRLRIGEYTK
jgi:tRNA pseudouridine55 synthase